MKHRRGNPTLVHHRKARAARWHVLDGEGHPVADLYVRSLSDAQKIARGFAAQLKDRMLLLDNRDLPKLLGAHRQVTVRASGRRHVTMRVGGPKRKASGRRRRGKVRGRGLERRKNPAPLGVVVQAARTYTMWHGFGSSRTTRVNIPAPPRALVKLGDAVKIEYLSHKGDGRRRRYAHDFEKPYPVLATGTDGKHLLLVGGRVQITERGLVH
jgi:hypothetical protein